MTLKAYGTARDRSGNIVPGAVIRLYLSGVLAYTATAKPNGQWDVSVAAGTYDVLDQDGDWVRGVVFVDTAVAQVYPVWSEGSGVPADVDGANGDVYVRTTTDVIYLKVAGAWVVKYTPLAIVQPAWTTGVVAPDNGDGSNGDNYTDTAAGMIYHKAAGAWAVVATYTVLP